jgi:hypothetical protein
MHPFHVLGLLLCASPLSFTLYYSPCESVNTQASLTAASVSFGHCITKAREQHQSVSSHRCFIACDLPYTSSGPVRATSCSTRILSSGSARSLRLQSDFFPVIISAARAAQSSSSHTVSDEIGSRSFIHSLL